MPPDCSRGAWRKRSLKRRRRRSSKPTCPQELGHPVQWMRTGRGKSSCCSSFSTIAMARFLVSMTASPQNCVPSHPRRLTFDNSSQNSSQNRMEGQTSGARRDFDDASKTCLRGRSENRERHSLTRFPAQGRKVCGMALKPSGRVRWLTTLPFRQTLLSDGVKNWCMPMSVPCPPRPHRRAESWWCDLFSGLLTGRS